MLNRWVVGGILAWASSAVIAGAPAAPPVEAGRLEAHVKRLSVDFHPRRYDHARNLALTAQYISDEFKRSNAAVTMQEVLVEGVGYSNVIARFGPQTGPLLVIGAHYDSCGETPGADDNASGVAGILELARLLGQRAPTQPVELVAYTLEEPPFFRTGHMGSAWHARSLKAANTTVDFMLSLEMIGYFSDTPGSQRYPAPGMSFFYSDRGDFISLVGNMGDFWKLRRIKSTMAGATPLPVHSIGAPASIQGIDFSDHLNYWNEGYSAFMVTDTAFMRNTNYHLPDDTYETLDYARMARVVEAVYALTQRSPKKGGR